MDKPDVFMPLYIGDYLAGTSRLTTELHGAYLLLIFDYWMNGPLPDDDEALAAISKMSIDAWSIARARLEHYFNVAGGCWKHGRIEQELAIASEKKRKSREKAEKAANSRWGNASSNASSKIQALHNECPSPSPSPSPSFRDIGDSEKPESPPHKKSGRSSPKKPIPEIFTVTREMIAWVEENNFGHINLADETDRFIDHWKSKGETRADWVAGWRTWIRNAERFQREAKNHGGQRDAISAAIHGH